MTCFLSGTFTVRKAYKQAETTETLELVSSIVIWKPEDLIESSPYTCILYTSTDTFLDWPVCQDLLFFAFDQICCSVLLCAHILGPFSSLSLVSRVKSMWIGYVAHINSVFWPISEWQRSWLDGWKWRCVAECSPKGAPKSYSVQCTNEFLNVCMSVCTSSVVPHLFLFLFSRVLAFIDDLICFFYNSKWSEQQMWKVLCFGEVFWVSLTFSYSLTQDAWVWVLFHDHFPILIFPASC